MRVEEVEAAIGFHFSNRELLIRALTHGSHLGEAGIARSPDADNEQLEFLGDAVLGMIVSEHVIRHCPDFDEGQLSNLKHQLVNRTHLADVARKLHLGDHLVLGKAEDRSGGRAKASLLANALEALLGAVYLDAGLEAAKWLVLAQVIAGADLRSLGTIEMNNYKAALETTARERDFAKPEYSVRAEQTGFPQSFVAEVRVSETIRATGRGSSKKKAEMEAARELLNSLREAT